MGIGAGLSKSTLERLVNLVGIESDDDRTVDDNYGSGHIAEPLQIRKRAWVLGDISLLKAYALLRKILLRLVAEHSPVLGKDNDVLRHSPPPVESALLALKR